MNQTENCINCTNIGLAGSIFEPFGVCQCHSSPFYERTVNAKNICEKYSQTVPVDIGSLMSKLRTHERNKK